MAEHSIDIEGVWRASLAAPYLAICSCGWMGCVRRLLSHSVDDGRDHQVRMADRPRPDRAQRLAASTAGRPDDLADQVVTPAAAGVRQQPLTMAGHPLTSSPPARGSAAT